MDKTLLPSRPNFRNLIKPAVKILRLIILSLVLVGCGGIQPGAPSPIPLTITSAPNFASSTPTRTPTDTDTATPNSTVTADLRASPTHLPSPSVTPMPTLINGTGPAAYRLKPWDRVTALRVIREAGDAPLSEDYQDFRGFYQVSMLYEAKLKFPDLREDPGWTDQMASLKGLSFTYFLTYALLHDHAVEPFRRMVETALNDESASLMALGDWVQSHGAGLVESTWADTRLFGQSGSAMVVEVRANGNLGLLVIRADASGHYSVFALYPEWKLSQWSDETFQLTDLNANGREEIAVTHTNYGTGSSHFCQRSFTLYEWDGVAFRDQMTEPLEVYNGSNDYGCMDISFVPDPRGGRMIQAGIQQNTICADLPYIERTTFRWDGRGFKKQAGPTAQPPGHSGLCALDWALNAGLKNEDAIRILDDSLGKWPSGAELVWGQAGRDYLRMKLAVWNIRRGHLDAGLDLLRQVRDHPEAPAYPLPARVAFVFLSTYDAEGLYSAVQAVDALYLAEWNQVNNNCLSVCKVDQLREKWGFAEPEWESEFGLGFVDDFDLIRSPLIALKQISPSSLDELRIWLERNRLQYAWAEQGNLDGQGEMDWLVEIVKDDNMYDDHQLYAFLRQNGRVEPVVLDQIYLHENNTSENRRWQSFQPSPGVPPVNILQNGSDLYAFRLVQSGGTYQMVVDENSATISPHGDEKDRVQVRDWKIDGRRLVVQYEGREAVYTWDPAQGRLVPTGFAPDLQEENVYQAEQALYIDNNPAKALEILHGLLGARIFENYIWIEGAGITNPPRLRPYMEYLLGLAYERSGDDANAVRAYWQLLHDYPDNPFSLAARSKLES